MIKPTEVEKRRHKQPADGPDSTMYNPATIVEDSYPNLNELLSRSRDILEALEHEVDFIENSLFGTGLSPRSGSPEISHCSRELVINMLERLNNLYTKASYTRRAISND